MSDRGPGTEPPRPDPKPGSSPGEQADKQHLRELQKARQAKVTKAIVALAIVVLLIVFVIQNSDRVEIDFVFFTRQARLIWVLVVMAILGGVAGYLLGRPSKKARLHDEKKKK